MTPAKRTAKPAAKSTMQQLLRFAVALPDIDEGIACAGTALESRTITTNGKAVVFLRAQDARLKLGASLQEAAVCAKEAPDRVVVGSGGWVQLKFDDAADPVDVYQRWIAESHALCGAAKAARSRARGAGKAKKARPRK